MYWSKFSDAKKQTDFKKQFKPSFCSPCSIIPRAFLARFPFLFALIFVLLGCGGGAAGNLSPAPSGANSLSGSATAGSAILNQPSVPLSTFGSAGFGGDGTSVLQNALDATASTGQVLRIPAANYEINPISFPDNSQVIRSNSKCCMGWGCCGPEDSHGFSAFFRNGVRRSAIAPIA